MCTYIYTCTYIHVYASGEPYEFREGEFFSFCFNRADMLNIDQDSKWDIIPNTFPRYYRSYVQIDYVKNLHFWNNVEKNCQLSLTTMD